MTVDIVSKEAREQSHPSVINIDDIVTAVLVEENKERREKNAKVTDESQRLPEITHADLGNEYINKLITTGAGKHMSLSSDRYLANVDLSTSPDLLTTQMMLPFLLSEVAQNLVTWATIDPDSGAYIGDQAHIILEAEADQPHILHINTTQTAAIDQVARDDMEYKLLLTKKDTTVARDKREREESSQDLLRLEEIVAANKARTGRTGGIGMSIFNVIAQTQGGTLDIGFKPTDRPDRFIPEYHMSIDLTKAWIEDENK